MKILLIQYVISCALQTLPTRVKKKEEEEEEDILPADIFVLRVAHFLSTFSSVLFLSLRKMSQK